MLSFAIALLGFFADVFEVFEVVSTDLVVEAFLVAVFLEAAELTLLLAGDAFFVVFFETDFLDVDLVVDFLVVAMTNTITQLNRKLIYLKTLRYPRLTHVVVRLSLPAIVAVKLITALLPS